MKGKKKIVWYQRQKKDKGGGYGMGDILKKLRLFLAVICQSSQKAMCYEMQSFGQQKEKKTRTCEQERRSECESLRG